MPRLYGRSFTKADLLRRIGNISQVGGIEAYTLSEGNEFGVRALDFRTGTGFHFVVLPDRGMDIPLAEFRGQSLCWRSPTGQVGSAHYDFIGTGWLRSFYGGLLTTCGLVSAGAPSRDNGEDLPLHGRVSHIPARNVAFDGEWDGDEYIFWAQGKIRETSVFGPNVLLTRKVWSRLGESRLWIEDTVENQGFAATPHMCLYHINAGFPVLDAGAELIIATRSVTPWLPASERGLKECRHFTDPIEDFEEQVFYHDVVADEEGYCHVALVNRDFDRGTGFGLYVRYRQDNLPNLIEWKMLGEGTYAVGIEPANCLPEGRDKERQRGTLQFLEPGERREYRLEIGVLASEEEILEFKRLAPGADALHSKPPRH
jgi:hypothetical protein